MSGKKQGVTTYDSSSSFESPVFHPSTMMGIFTMTMAGIVQMTPKDFLPDKYVGVKLSGLPPQRLVLLPALAITMVYAAIGIQVFEGHQARGHLLSLGVSFSCAGVAFAFAKHSVFHWFIFAVYAAYGALYDGRRLVLYSDGAPMYRWGDFKKIYREREAAKKQLLADKSNGLELRRRQYESALAARDGSPK